MPAPGSSLPRSVGVMVLFFILLSRVGFADQQGGQRPAAYLEMGVGGTQAAMGGATAGVRNDVACGFWNPAGLTGLRGFQIEDQYTVLSLGQTLNYVGLANSFRDRFFYGLSFIYYSAGSDLEARVGPTADPDSVFADTEMAFIGSMAFRLNTRLSAGINFKVLTQSIGTFASGFGLGGDLGLQYRLSPDTTLGLMARDVLTSLTYNTSTSSSSSNPEQIIPTTLRAGIAQRQEDIKVKADCDIEWSQDLGFRPRFGMEWRPAESLAVRGGAWAGNLTAGASGGVPLVYWTAGIGLLLPMNGNLLEFDYSLLEDRVNPGSFLHQATIVGKFL